MSLMPPFDNSWKEILKQNVYNLESLSKILNLSDDQITMLDNPDNFTMNIPIRLVRKMKKSTINDPIFLQFVPLKNRSKSKGFCKDPLNEERFQKTDILIHKYHGRILLLFSGSCAMHCRYCFRAHFDYKPRGNLEKEIEYIKSDNSIEEVILSGGDPLSVSDNIFYKECKKIASIPNIKRIRIHTRFPIGIPERITDSFLHILEEIGKEAQIWFVIHSNHPLELDCDVLHALKKIQLLGIPVISHSVLLKGVNDNTDVLKKLFVTMINNGIQPYYINKLDKVSGSEIFELAEESELDLIASLNCILPGYAIPRFVQEVPGISSKLNLGPSMYKFTSYQQDQYL